MLSEWESVLGDMNGANVRKSRDSLCMCVCVCFDIQYIE